MTVAFDASQLSANEGMYELRALTLCGPGLETASEPVTGRIDRVPPRLFGAFQEPADRLWWPGDKIALRFTEDVLCDRPFPFVTSIAIVGGAVKPVGSSVDIICTTNTIEVAFSRTLISAPDELIGKEVTLRVADVVDLALNRLATVAEWSFTVGAFDETAVSVTLSDVRVPLALLGENDTDINAAVARVLAGPDGPIAQLTVSSVSASTRRRQAGAETAVDVVVAPSDSVAGGRSALRFANAILTRTDVDSSNTGVSMSGPAQPILDEPSPPFFTTGGGIAVIVVLALVGLLLIGGLVACLLLRRKKEKAPAPDEPKATEMRATPPTKAREVQDDHDVPRRTSSRKRSRRSQRSSATLPAGAAAVEAEGTYTPLPIYRGSAAHNTSAPTTDSVEAGDTYTPLPIYRGSAAYDSSTAAATTAPIVPRRLSSRKRSSRRRSGRRGTSEMAAIPAEVREN